MKKPEATLEDAFMSVINENNISTEKSEKENIENIEKEEEGK